MKALQFSAYGSPAVLILKEIANVMNHLRAGFQEGYLHPPPITTWPFERAIEAYEAAEKGWASTKHILIPDTKPEP